MCGVGWWPCVRDLVLDGELGARRARRVAAPQHEVLRERAGLVDLAAHGQGARVAGPGRAVLAQDRGRGRDPTVQPVRRLAPARVVERVVSVDLREQDVIEARGRRSAHRRTTGGTRGPPAPDTRDPRSRSVTARRTTCPGTGTTRCPGPGPPGTRCPDRRSSTARRRGRPARRPPRGSPAAYRPIGGGRPRAAAAASNRSLVISAPSPQSKTQPPSTTSVCPVTNDAASLARNSAAAAMSATCRVA